MKRFLLAALHLGAAAGLGLAVWRAVMNGRAKRISALLSAQLPRQLSRWADAIAYGAVRTVPADFPADSEQGDVQLAWAKFGAAVMDRESEGSSGAGYSPRDVWDGEGDGGRAATPWQLDKRYHAKYLGSAGRSPEGDSAYAFGMLAERWRGARSRTENLELAQAATAAAYNADEKKVFAALDAGGGVAAVDALTTGNNYGSDVLRRLGEFS